MSNMGYCRFRNTLEDMRDCAQWLAENKPTNLLSEEYRAYEKFVRLCQKIAADYGTD